MKQFGYVQIFLYFYSIKRKGYAISDFGNASPKILFQVE